MKKPLPEEIQMALVRLNDAICMFERSSGIEFTLALVPHAVFEKHVSVNGKPVVAEHGVPALRHMMTLADPPKLTGEKLRDALIAEGKVLCKSCKGTGLFFDIEDEEMISCNRCGGTGHG